MKISVIGCGYLGAVHAACMAELGHEVVGIDVDPAKVELLAHGEPPFYEPRLADLLRAGLDAVEGSVFMGSRHQRRSRGAASAEIVLSPRSEGGRLRRMFPAPPPRVRCRRQDVTTRTERR